MTFFSVAFALLAICGLLFAFIFIYQEFRYPKDREESFDDDLQDDQFSLPSESNNKRSPLIKSFKVLIQMILIGILIGLVAKSCAHFLGEDRKGRASQNCTGSGYTKICD